MSSLNGVLEFATHCQWFTLHVSTLSFLTVFHLNRTGSFSDTQRWSSFLTGEDPI